MKDRADLKWLLEACKVARAAGDEAGAARMEAISKRLDLAHFISYTCLQVLKTCPTGTAIPPRATTIAFTTTPSPTSWCSSRRGWTRCSLTGLLPESGVWRAGGAEFSHCRDARGGHVKRMKEILRVLVRRRADDAIDRRVRGPGSGGHQANGRRIRSGRGGADRELEGADQVAGEKRHGSRRKALGSEQSEPRCFPVEQPRMTAAA